MTGALSSLIMALQRVGVYRPWGGTARFSPRHYRISAWWQFGDWPSAG